MRPASCQQRRVGFAVRRLFSGRQRTDPPKMLAGHGADSSKLSYMAASLFRQSGSSESFSIFCAVRSRSQRSDEQGRNFAWRRVERAVRTDFVRCARPHPETRLCGCCKERQAGFDNQSSVSRRPEPGRRVSRQFAAASLHVPSTFHPLSINVAQPCLKLACRNFKTA